MLKKSSQLLADEDRTLASYAMKNSESAGRLHPEPDDLYRVPFQRDRARILHSKSFRRLQAKTQVFVSYQGDHYRDRMVHSLEVSQIARDISRTLGLNEDLSECLALAHDLGHPPFGHGGEAALDEVLKRHGLHFEHNEQSRRIVEKLEKIHPDFDGLNVTKEVLDGLLKHHPHTYHTYLQFNAWPHLEAQVVDMADEIAYTQHDIDDGIRSGLITAEQLEQFALWRQAREQVENFYHRQNFQENDSARQRFHARIISRLIKLMIHDLYLTTTQKLERHNIHTLQDVRNFSGKLVDFSAEMRAQLANLRQFLMQNFYLNPAVAIEIDRGKKIIQELFAYYFQYPERMPPAHTELLKGGERIEIVIKDYLAGMTDHYALEQWKRMKNESGIKNYE